MMEGKYISAVVARVKAPIDTAKSTADEIRSAGLVSAVKSVPDKFQRNNQSFLSDVGVK